MTRPLPRLAIMGLLILLLFGMVPGQLPPAQAALPPEAVLSDPAQEQRARTLAEQLRCVVCPNQSIADSDATLATDMQRLIRRRITAGKTDAEIIDELHRTYGDRVLLKPPVNDRTLALWGLPALLGLLAVGGLALGWYRGRRAAISEKSPLEPLAIDGWAEQTPDDKTDSGAPAS